MGESSADQTQHTFLLFDGLRGIAAMAVALRHLSPLLWSVAPFSSYLAVDFFFCLSGFVLAHAYERRFAAGLNATGFLRLRIVRLYPLYLLGLLLSLIAVALDPVAHKPPAVVVSLLWSFLFFPTPMHVPFMSEKLIQLDPPIWSIFFELVINVVYALSFRYLGERVLAAFVGVMGVLLIVVSGMFGSLDVGWSIQNFAGGGVRVFFAFPLGVLLYRFWRSQPSRMHLNPYIAVLVLAGCMLVHLPGRGQAVFDLVAAMVIFPVLIYGGSGPIARQNWLGKSAMLLGGMSYALYVLHYPAEQLVLSAYRRLHLQPATPVTGIVLFLAVSALAAFADRYYDQPLRRLFKGKKRLSIVSTPLEA